MPWSAEITHACPQSERKFPMLFFFFFTLSTRSALRSVLQERSFGLNLASIKDLASSQRGVIRGRGPCSSGRSFTSGPVCCIVRRLKPVCWKVFSLFHMIDLPLFPTPTPLSDEVGLLDPLFTASLRLFYLFTCQHLTYFIAFLSFSLTLVFLFLPHCRALLSSSSRSSRSILRMEVFFSALFLPLSLSLSHFFSPRSFFSFSLPLSARPPPCGLWYRSAIPVPPPVAALEGHSWYNYSFWLSCRLTPGWPGPSSASSLYIYFFFFFFYCCCCCCCS